MTSGSSDRRFIARSIALFSALTGILFWRYAAGLTTTVSDTGDPLLLVWVMEWVGRALVSAPWDLFQAPMFHPFPDALGYTDPVVPQAVLALPLRLLGLGPIAAYNIVFLFGIASTGILCTVLFHELSQSKSAAIVAAVAATFPAIRLFQLGHLALQVTTFWPLAFLLMHRLMRKPTWTLAAVLAATLVVAALGSLYFGLFLAILVPPFVVCLWLVQDDRSPKALAMFVASGATAGALFLPVARVYDRAPRHLAQSRGPSDYSDLAHYLGFSPFADLGEWLGSLVVRNASPEWVGGGAVFVAWGVALWLFVLLGQRALGRGGDAGAPWVRNALPYVALACTAVLLSLGPSLQWHGRVVAPNPLGFLFHLPGMRNIRDFQRVGFAVAFASGAVLAVVLSRLQSKAPRLHWGAVSLVLVTALAPSFSTSLPEFRPPDVHPVHDWIRDQPEPFVLYEAPLGRRSELEPLLYLWTSAHHRKRIVHGFSGYLPLTDDTLRGEAQDLHRSDFFQSLAVLGATHLLVHVSELEALPGGPSALLGLRETHRADRVAVFDDYEVYRVGSSREPVRPPPPRELREPLFARGGVVDMRPEVIPHETGGCTEFAGSTGPLVLYTPEAATLFGLKFVAQSEIGRMDDALAVEVSSDTRVWKPVSHEPLLSKSLSAYVRQPTPEFQTHADFTGEGPFLRLSGRPAFRLRACGIRAKVDRPIITERLQGAALHARSEPQPDLAALATDGQPTTRWHSGGFQQGAEWIEVDLGARRRVASAILELGDFASDYGRRLALECVNPADERPAELDGQAILLERPRTVQVLALSPPRSCQVLRVRQVGKTRENYWSVSEIVVLVEAAPRGSDQVGAGDQSPRKPL